jgi:lipid-A-disaccharide synthase
MKLLVSALEASSNIHLEALLKELDSDCELTGIFDQRLGKPIHDNSEMAVMGFIDAIKRLPFFFRIKDEMVELAQNADKVLLMDSSGFNLPLAKAIKKKCPDKEIIYYILPQAWAWRRGRIPKIEAACDRLCSILPFESQYYSQKEKITYVGHPLLDEINHFKTSLTSSDKIAFMPGSRKGEIRKLIPIFDEVRKSIDKKAVLIVPKFFDLHQLEEIYGPAVQNYEISTDTHSALKACDFAFICSGTATLEATLIGTPFVLCYQAKKLDYFIARRFAHTTHVGLANIMNRYRNGQTIHNELLQEDVTKENILHEFHTMDREEFFKDAAKIKEYLAHGSSKNVAKIIKET